MKYYMIEEQELEYLRVLRSRMHSQTRLTADEMRDIGHTLDNITRVAIVVPDEERKP